MSPTVLSTADAPATTTRATTAIQPRPWMADPMARPTAPPNTPTALIRSTRLRYEPPRSVIVPSSPPVAGSKPMLGLPTANPVPSGTQIASVARIMSGHGSGAGFGRTSSASQSGTVAARIAAVRALIRAGLRSSLDLPYIACAPPRRRSFYGTDRGNSLRPELATPAGCDTASPLVAVTL